MPADAREDLVTTELRKADVEQHDVDRLLEGQDRPVLAVVGGQHLVAGRREPSFQQAQDRRFVLDRENAHVRESSGGTRR